MLQRVFAILMSLLFVSTSMASTDAQVEKEQLYDKYILQISKYPNMLPSIAPALEDKKIFVDALWDVVVIAKQKSIQAQIKAMDARAFSLADQIRLAILKSYPEKATLPEDLKRELYRTDDRRAHLTLQSYQNYLVRLPQLHVESPFFGFRIKTKSEIRDLFFNNPDLSGYEEGKYANGVYIYMFCRRSRKQKCIFLMKDKNGNPVTTEDGELWHQPSLGLSKYGIPSHQRNGNTPSGVYTIDSVMPEANKPTTYGKFRRLIINFLPKAEGEANNKLFLPESAREKRWWREAMIARDVGRSLLRIHGTGQIKSTPRDPNHPLRPTLGCVMQREGRVGKTTYKDQRRLLDASMTAMELEPVFSNETKIHGALYVIDIDDKQKAVSYKEIKEILQN